MSIQASTKIDFELTGELAYRLNIYLDKGYFATKPEAVRQALRVLFDEIDEKEFQRLRMETLQS